MVLFEVFTTRLLRAIVAEFLGTLIFVLLALSSTTWMAEEDKLQSSTLLLISLSFGLSISTMVFCFGHISGAHFNPAVTVAMILNRKISITRSFFYMVAQCFGATAGIAILEAITPQTPGWSVGVTMLSSNITLAQGITVELLITFQLVFTVLITCDPKYSDHKGTAALAVGFAVFIGHLLAVPYTGASMNPARSIGPAIITWQWENHWVYWVGPICGGIIAALLNMCLCNSNLELKDSVVDDFSKDLLERQEQESVDLEKGEGSQRVEALVVPKTGKAEMIQMSTIYAERSRSMELEHVYIDTVKEEKNDLSNYPQYEIKLNF